MIKKYIFYHFHNNIVLTQQEINFYGIDKSFFGRPLANFTPKSGVNLVISNALIKTNCELKTLILMFYFKETRNKDFHCTINLFGSNKGNRLSRHFNSEHKKREKFTNQQFDNIQRVTFCLL